MLIDMRINERGFTLIELMIGVVILAIVLAVGMPSYSTWIQNTRLRNTAESILNGLQLARSEAVARNSAVQFTLGAGSSWTVCLLAANTCVQTIQQKQTGEGSSAAVQVAATPAGETSVTFNNLGRLTTTLITQIDIDIDPAVLPASESRNLRIQLNAGSARMCDPNVEAPDLRAC